MWAKGGYLVFNFGVYLVERENPISEGWETFHAHKEVFKRKGFQVNTSLKPLLGPAFLNILPILELTLTASMSTGSTVGFTEKEYIVQIFIPT